jgi:cysteine desulfurase
MTMPAWIYLDNNATTRPDARVVEAMQQMQIELWANPSSVHRFGQMVRQKVELARAQVAELIGVKPREIILTSGGTESNNLALRGVMGTALDPHRRVLISNKVEHAAIRETAAALEREGVRIVWLGTDGHGQIAPSAVADALCDAADDRATLMLSIQWANNETGLIQPIDAIASVVRELRRALLARRCRVAMHVDATQAVGKLPVDLGPLTGGVDLLTLAAHKFHGPKGVGALYVRPGSRLRPVQVGGPQERNQRGGTENAPGIVGMGVAAQLAAEFVQDADRVDALRRLRDRFESLILAELPETVVNARDDATHARLWNTTNLGFAGIEAEAILLALSERGVCASAGAACSSGSLEPSPVLLAMGVPEPIAHGSVRFSLSRDTVAADIEQAASAVVDVVRRLARTLPLGAASR